MHNRIGRARSWSSSGYFRRGGARLVTAFAVVLLISGCARPDASAPATPAGLVALVADGGDVALVGWDATGDAPIPIELPGGVTVWVATGRADVLAATRADGTVATSDPIHLGDPLDWRRVRASGPDGDDPTEPAAFATWDPEGGRYAILVGDLASGDGVSVVLVDPTVRSAFEIVLDRPVVAAPPAWIGDDRLAVISGETADPATTLIDTTTGDLSDGPTGVRLLAASADARTVATMAGRSSPIVVRDTTAWLDGDGSSIGSVDPPADTAAAIAFALDDAGQRLAVAWADKANSVTISVYDRASGWRRITSPKIGPAQGAVVAWRRGATR